MYQFFLQYSDKVKQILRIIVANVIYLIRRNGQTVFSRLLFRSVLHHTHHTLHNIVYISEVALAVTVVEYLDGLAIHQFISESEVSHVRTSGRAIDRKEAESGTGNVIEFTVGMRHELVAFLRGGIKRHGIVHLIVR